MSRAIKISANKYPAKVHHDMTSKQVPLTVSATAVQNEDGGPFR